MTLEEKIAELENLFEAAPGSVKAETRLAELPWDSMSMLALIAILDEKFHRKVKGTELKAFTRVQDILNVMQ